MPTNIVSKKDAAGKMFKKFTIKDSQESVFYFGENVQEIEVRNQLNFIFFEINFFDFKNKKPLEL